MATGVSVIICCYNSAQRICETLQHLQLQKTDSSLPWEIIVVDNASTDNTAQTALDFWKKLKSPVKLSVVNEPKPGLSHARTTGVNYSFYDIIIFCDDDNWLSENYVQTAFEVLSKNELIGAAGGEGFAISDMPLPNWFNEYKTYFACYPQADQTCNLVGTSAFLYGAGLVIRRRAIAHINSLNVDFLLSDRKGGQLTSGGDNELCYFLRFMGYEIWYDERLKFHHYIPVIRLSKSYLLKLVMSISYSSAYLVVYQHIIAGNPVNRTTWAKDFIYRFYLILMELFKPSVHKIQFGALKASKISIMPLFAIIQLFGKYRKIYLTVSQIRKISKADLA